MNTESIRNIGLIGHGDAGKTSLAEAFLYAMKSITRMGKVDEGNTVSDFNTDEIERKISISSSLLHGEWNGKKINIVDTPGYPDFTGEVKCAIPVIDLGLVVINAASGIEVGTEMVWQYAQEAGIPKAIVVNKLDKENLRFDETLENIRKMFGQGVVVFQFPVKTGPQFTQIVDVLQMKMHEYTAGGDGKFNVADIPGDVQAQAQKFREQLVEAAAEGNDQLLEKYLEQGELSEEEIVGGIRTRITSGALTPLFCMSAAGNIGTGRVLDYIVDYCPYPGERKPVTGLHPSSGEEVLRKITANEPVSIMIFKTISEPHVGELSLFRVNSGILKSGMDLSNANRGHVERISQIFMMNGRERKEIGSLAAGDLGAIVKLKNTHTSDTLCDKGNPVKYPEIQFPPAAIRTAVEPKSKEDEDKISSGLQMLHDEDPSFYVQYDPELKQTILSGQGELHLEVIIKRLKEKFHVDVELVPPKIPFRETIRGTTEIQGKFKRQSGGRGQYGDTWLKLEPQPRGTGFEFVDAIVGGVIPGKYVPACEKGIIEAMAEGAIAGFPVVDVKVTLFDGSYHTVDSSDMAFKIAASMGFKKGVAQANPVILEPIYDVEIKVPEEFMGDVMGDISSRRGKILGMDAVGTHQVIRVKVPLAELYRYSTHLRSLTHGRGVHQRKFSHYEEVPRDIQEKLVAEYEAKRAEGR